LTDHAAEDWDPVLSPDGRRLAFSSNRTGRFQIWLAEPDGGSPRPLTAVENAQNPSFSPDSAWIFFTLQDAGPERNGLWKIRTDGGEPTRIVAGSTFVPEVSADGRLVAFNRSLAGALVPIEGGTPLEIGPAVRFRWTNVGGALRLWLLDGGGRQTSIRRLALEPGRPPDPAEATTVLADPAGSLETFAVRPDGAALAVSRTSSENTLIVRIDGLAGLESPE
jgi:Tol biopolymer transport system component